MEKWLNGKERGEGATHFTLHHTQWMKPLWRRKERRHGGMYLHELLVKQDFNNYTLLSKRCEEFNTCNSSFVESIFHKKFCVITNSHCIMRGEGAAQRIPMQRSFSRDRVAVCTSGNYTLGILSKTSHPVPCMLQDERSCSISQSCSLRRCTQQQDHSRMTFA